MSIRYGYRNKSLSREVDRVRRAVLDGFKWAGQMFICRQRIQFFDSDDRCPYCWDSLLKQVKDSRCSHCGGTGILGGYKAPIVVWASLAENSNSDIVTDKSGIAEKQDMEIKLGSPPLFYDGDVFAEVRDCGLGSSPRELGRIFRLDGPVRRQTIHGWVSSNTTHDEGRDTSIEKMIVSQAGTVKLLPPTDDMYKRDLAWWGIQNSPYLPQAEG